MLEDTALGTECPHIFCARFSPLQLGVVLVFLYFQSWSYFQFIFTDGNEKEAIFWIKISNVCTKLCEYTWLLWLIYFINDEVYKWMFGFVDVFFSALKMCVSIFIIDCNNNIIMNWFFDSVITFRNYDIIMECFF